MMTVYRSGAYWFGFHTRQANGLVSGQGVAFSDGHVRWNQITNPSMGATDGGAGIYFYWSEEH